MSHAKGRLHDMPSKFLLASMSLRTRWGKPGGTEFFSKMELRLGQSDLSPHRAQIYLGDLLPLFLSFFLSLRTLPWLELLRKKGKKAFFSPKLKTKLNSMEHGSLFLRLPGAVKWTLPNCMTGADCFFYCNERLIIIRNDIYEPFRGISYTLIYFILWTKWGSPVMSLLQINADSARPVARKG